MNEHEVVDRLRDFAREGYTVTCMFNELKLLLGNDEVHIVDILGYFRSAFYLTLKEAKPIAALSRSEGREVSDEHLLEQLVMPAIKKHRDEWDKQEVE
ncbi:hypothetical protein [uncultured Gimesia sp.]|uniref:hypothetical protein n=1 Tax=uncultured Gimesia sp. TaxID=1678688 RepID=UPI002636D10A|nr:hypothetical protein [uncultured Gimesia sp.]